MRLAIPFAEAIEYPAVFVLATGKHIHVRDASEIDAVPQDVAFNKQGILWNGVVLYIEVGSIPK